MANRRPITAQEAGLFEELEAVNLAGQVNALVRHGLLPNSRILRFGPAVAAVTDARLGRKLNHVVGLGLGIALSASDLAHIEEAYAEIGCPVEIDLCPFAEASTIALLGERGYAVNAFGNTYVHRDLAQLDPARLTSAILVREMAESEFEDFQRWSVAGFSAQDNPRSLELLKLLAISATHREDTILFVAEIQGKIAGTAALSVIDLGPVRAAHLHLASTLTGFRGRGVQAALLSARLHEAAFAGASLATVTARPKSSSARNAERAGFTLAYTKPTFARSQCLQLVVS